MYARFKLLILGVLLCSIGYIAYRIHAFGYFSADTVSGIMERNSWLAVPATIGIFVCASILPIPSTPLILAAGAVFGPIRGPLYAMVGETVGACIAFVFARILGEEAIERWLKSKHRAVYSYEQRLQERGIETTLFLRLLPIVPLAPLNYALGLTKIRFTHYAIGSALGLFMVTFVYSYLGAALSEHSPQSMLIGTAVAFGFLLILLFVRALSRKTHDDRAAL